MALMGSGVHTTAGSGTVVVKPSAMNGWYFWNDFNDTFAGSPGALVSGPGAPPAGTGSVELGPLTDNGATAGGHSMIATDAYAGTPLADITALSYSTYQPGPTQAIALQFDVSYQGGLAFGGRLVFEPYQNGAVSVGSGWQSWSPLSGIWWATKVSSPNGTGGTQIVPLPAGNCAMSTPCTWSQIKAAFPAAKVLGRFLLKAGSNWNGFDGNADNLTIGVSGSNTTFDFEAETPCTTTCYVDAATGNDSFGGNAPGAAKKTIQAAINQVSLGGTVQVAAGTYNEQVTVNRNLTLTGAGAATTIIQAPGVLTNDPDGAKTVVLFTGPITAAFSGFTVQGPVNGLNFGIYVRAGATANIHDNIIKDIRDNPLSGAQTGVAIEVGKTPDTAPGVSQTGTATITNNAISGYQKTGIAVENTGSSATITGNTITGAGAITTTAQNGIQIRRGAIATITTNTVTGNAYDGPTYSDEGIGALHAGNGVVIQGNIVNHNSANIYAWKSDGIQVLNNQVSDSSPVDQNASAGITVQSDGPSCCGGATGAYITGVTISGNTIQNNRSGGSSQGDGIDIYDVNGATVSGNTITGASHDGILIGGSGNTAFTNNQFSGNGLGFADPNAAAIDFGGQPTGNGGPNTLGGFTAHSNSFVGNRNGIWNYDIASVNATDNWWGSASGPKHASNTFNVSLQGDKVSDNVTFVPWLNAAPPTGVSFAPVTDTNPVGSFASIQAGVNASNAGGTVNAAAGTFTENVVVGNEVTIAGAGQASTFVIPAVSNPNCGGLGGGSLCAGGSNIMLVQADNVTIHDIGLNGDNPTLASGIVAGGADVDARNGIITNHALGVYNNLTVHDVTVKNIYLRGIYASSGGTFNFNHDTVQNVQADPSSVAMFNFGGSGLMTDNHVLDANDAIASNHSSGTQFLNNTITASGSGVHTDNAGDGGGVADLIKDNVVTNSTYGVWVFVPYIAPTLQSNTITNVDVGLAAFGQGASVTSNFIGNIVDGQNKPGSTGAYVTTDQLGSGFANSSASFTGNRVVNNVDGFYFDASLGGTVAVTATLNCIAGNTNSGMTAAPSVTAVNAENNWWGKVDGPNPPGHGDKIDPAATIDAVPFLVAPVAGCPVPLDGDGDGLNDTVDNCPTVYNPSQTNTDGINTVLNRPGQDTLGDACDPDISGDGYGNVAKAALGKNLLLYCSIMRADVDGDGVVSILDLSRAAQKFGQTFPPTNPAVGIDTGIQRLNQDADNVISILDVSRMAQDYTKHVTACP
jgi:parallel beta-helix repeat protein